MVISFKNDISEYNIFEKHAYTLLDYTEKTIKLYDPKGITLMIPTDVFDENVRRFYISYIDNNIFRMSKPNTSVEFADSWNNIYGERFHSDIDYDCQRI